MTRDRTTHVLAAMTLGLVTLASVALGKSESNDPNRYLNAVREFAGNRHAKQSRGS